MLLKEPGHVLAFKGLRELLQGIILQGKNLHLAMLRFQNLILVFSASAVPKARPPPPMHPKMGPAFGGFRNFIFI